MKKGTLLFCFILITIIILPLFLVAFINRIDETSSDPEFFVGVEYAIKNGSVEDCKALVDRVKNFTNLFIVDTFEMTRDINNLTEVCDYVYESGLFFMVFFISQVYASGDQYILRYNPHAEERVVAEMLVKASFSAQLTQPADYRVLLALARFESTYRLGAINPTSGARGLIQLMPLHDDNIRAAGLDPDDEYDRLLYGALMIRWAMDKGDSLHHALRAWRFQGVRGRALSAFRRMK